MNFNEVKIVAQKVWLATPKKPLIAVAVLFALPALDVLTAFGIAPDTALEKIERHVVIEPLALPAHDADDTNVNENFNAIETVQRGDSVNALLARLNVDDRDAFEFLRSNAGARSIYQLKPGRMVEARTNAEGELLSLHYFHGGDQFLEVLRTPDGLRAEEKNLTTRTEHVYKSARINSSLFAASDSAKIPDAIAMQIARIFSTDIDFHIDLRKGDSFSVIYEMLYHEGELVGAGRVLSAQFNNNGKTFEAFLFSDGDKNGEGHDSYYSADGQSRAKSFLRSPLEFSRVSSNFGGRVHPIFKNWRAHTGVDFAAPKGTQVWSSADGVVEYAGVKGGYGNVVEIRHSAGITTLYGHLSAFAKGMHKGLRVQQGQVIAYVGSTGWATGPHLHYEFKISGMHHDPMKVALPKADPLPARYRAQFALSAESQSAQLATLHLRTDGGSSAHFE